jgi:hypothetical protein
MRSTKGNSPFLSRQRRGLNIDPSNWERFRGPLYLTGKIENAIFFDDDDKNIQSVTDQCSKIKTIKIDRTEELTETSIDSIPIELKGVPIELGKDINTYAGFLQKIEISDDLYDPKSGIQQEHIDQLNTWLSTIPPDKYTNTAAIFDWDRTLSVFEGIFPYSAIIENITFRKLDKNTDKINESMITYLLGGEARLRMIRNMLTMLSNKGIQLFILTNNGSCSSNDDFTKYVTLLTDKIPIENILCSFPEPYNSNKGAFLSSDPQFSLLCSPSLPSPSKPWYRTFFGGKTKRNRNRNRKYNRKQKTQKQRKSRK